MKGYLNIKDHQRKSQYQLVTIGLLLYALMSSSWQTTKYTRDVQVEYTPEHINLILPIVEPEKIYSMSLDRRKLRSLPEEMGRMKNLRYFDLNHVRIKDWEKSKGVFNCFHKLEKIRINFKNIGSLPFSPDQLKNLQQINLMGSTGYNLEDEITNLLQFPRLTSLMVGGLDCDALPENILQLTQLEKFNFGKHNEGFDYGEAINLVSQLPKLKALFIDIADLDSCVSGFNKLQHLEKLSIYNSQIDLEACLEKTANWPNLKTLRLIRMNITHIPSSITEHRSLKALLLPKNPNLDHHALFAQLVQMPQLEELDLSDTYRTSYYDSALVVPSELAQLSNLRKLDVSKNTVLDHKHLVETLVALPKLEYLDISYTSGPKYVVDLTDRFSQLKSLKVLKVSFAGPHAFDNVTKMPPSLETLDFSKARFNEDGPLPMIIFTATSLKSLNLNDGRLTELPEAIGNLTKLEHLDLGNNQLRDLPKSITKLKKLRYLNLMGTHISESEEKRREIEELLPNTLVFFGEYAAYNPNWGN